MTAETEELTEPSSFRDGYVTRRWSIAQLAEHLGDEGGRSRPAQSELFDACLWDKKTVSRRLSKEDACHAELTEGAPRGTTSSMDAFRNRSEDVWRATKRRKIKVS